MSETVEAARTGVLGMISRLTAWPEYERQHSLTDAAVELDAIKSGIGIKLDAYADACRAEGADEMRKEQATTTAPLSMRRPSSPSATMARKQADALAEALRKILKHYGTPEQEWPRVLIDGSAALAAYSTADTAGKV